MTGRAVTETDSVHSSDRGLRTADVHARAHDVDELAGRPDILAVLREHVVRAGFAGGPGLVEVLQLVVVSRVFDRPVSVAVRAESSAGKNFAVDTALEFVPQDATVQMAAASDKAMYYTGDSLRHRVLVFAEDDGFGGGDLVYQLRTLISEGKLVREVTDFENVGTTRVEVEGPTGLIFTTVGRIDPELQTRLLVFSVDESESQTSQILALQARQAAGLDHDRPDHEVFRLLHQRVVEQPPTVVVPFAPVLAGLVDVRPVRMRRDFPSLLGLVRAHALLHRETRAHDDDGRLLATLSDYAAVHRLVSGVIAQSARRTVTDTVRATVQAVEDLTAFSGGNVTAEQLATHLGLDSSSVRRRIAAAVETGYLANHGGGPGRPHRVTVGDDLPEDRGALPTPDELETSCSRARTIWG